jgi:hypothetical protein
MKIRIECVMVGGPEHGRVLIVRQDATRPQQPAIVAMDGQLCTCAIRRRTRRGGPRYLLMHPHASGQQLLDVLATCSSRKTYHRNQPSTRKSKPLDTCTTG